MFLFFEIYKCTRLFVTLGRFARILQALYYSSMISSGGRSSVETVAVPVLLLKPAADCERPQ